MQSTSEVNQLLDAKFAQSEKGIAKPKSDTKAFTEGDINSDAHRLAIRDTITGALKYVTGKRDPRSMDEAYSRIAPSLLNNTDQRTRDYIEETFAQRAKPSYEAPKAGSLRGDLTNAFDNKLADVTEAAETGYITTPEGGQIDADKDVGWE
jgi:hypothetical protein